MGLEASTSVSRALFIQPTVLNSKPGYIDSQGVFYPIITEKSGKLIAPAGTEISQTATQITLKGTCLYSGIGRRTVLDRVATFVKVAERWMLESVVPVNK